VEAFEPFAATAGGNHDASSNFMPSDLAEPVTWFGDEARDGFPPRKSSFTASTAQWPMWSHDSFHAKKKK